MSDSISGEGAQPLHVHHLALKRNLQYATEICDSANEKGDADLYREGVAKALAAVLHYLDATGIPQSTGTPLDQLFTALFRASVGVNDPLLMASKKSAGRPSYRDDVVEVRFRKYVALAMELMMRGGEGGRR